MTDWPKSVPDPTDNTLHAGRVSEKNGWSKFITVNVTYNGIHCRAKNRLAYTEKVTESIVIA
jgi:hypothetical protein